MLLTYLPTTGNYWYITYPVDRGLKVLSINLQDIHILAKLTACYLYLPTDHRKSFVYHASLCCIPGRQSAAHGSLFDHCVHVHRRTRRCWRPTAEMSTQLMDFTCLRSVSLDGGHSNNWRLVAAKCYRWQTGRWLRRWKVDFVAAVIQHSR